MTLTSKVLLCLAILAMAACTQPVREEDGNRPGDIYVQLGKAYIREGDYDQAMLKLQRGLEAAPNNPEIHSTLAVLHQRLGQDADAETHFRKAIKLTPKNSAVRNNYGAFLCHKDRRQEAEQQFLAAVDNPLYRAPEIAYTNAALCALKEEDAAAAETYFRSALAKNPRFPVALYQMARLSYDQGEYLQSRAYLQRYLAIAPHNAATLLQGIKTERKLGDEDTAASYALLLKARYPDSEEARLLRDLEQNDK